MSDSIQKVIQDMLNSVLPIINTPGGPYYLPTWIQTNGYDPFGKAEKLYWSLSTNDPAVIQTAGSICAQIYQNGDPCSEPKAFYIAAPGTAPALEVGDDKDFGGLLISGFSNAYMASMTSQASDPYTIIAIARFNTLPNYPPNAVISGKFTLTEYCCCSNDQKVCTTTPDAQKGTGTFIATVIGSATATITFRITDLSPGVLTIGVENVNIVPPMTNQGNPAVTITVDITSIPPNVNSQTYNNAATEALNSPQALNSILSQVNTIMNQSGQLSALGSILTQVIDGYLKSTHQYPFNTASLALY